VVSRRHRSCYVQATICLLCPLCVLLGDLGVKTPRQPPQRAPTSPNNTKIQLRLPQDLNDAAMRQAAVSGISLNLFVATAIAARVGATAEAARHFSARGARTTPARAKALLNRLGTQGQVRDDDRLDARTSPASRYSPPANPRLCK
jgi:hypothetical protein